MANNSIITVIKIHKLSKQTVTNFSHFTSKYKKSGKMVYDVRKPCLDLVSCQIVCLAYTDITQSKTHFFL